MTMPHPSVFMIPFGCVVCQRQGKAGTSIDLYLGQKEIENLHPAFTALYNSKTLGAIILGTQDDTSSALASYGDNAVIGNSTATVTGTYSIYRLHELAYADAKPELVSNINAVIAMELNYYYFLLKPHIIRARRERDNRDRERGRS